MTADTSKECKVDSSSSASGKHWAEAEVQELLKRRASGEPWKDTAQFLGRTPGAAQQKFNYLTWRRQLSNPNDSTPQTTPTPTETTGKTSKATSGNRGHQPEREWFQHDEPPAQTTYPISTRNTSRSSGLATCRFCHDSSSMDHGQSKACSLCGFRYHEACHLPPIDNIYLANETLRWYCAFCNQKGWHSDTPPVRIPRSISHEELGSRNRKRPRIEGVNDTNASLPEQHPDDSSAPRSEQELPCEEKQHGFESKGQDQQDFNLTKEWLKICKLVNKRLKGIDQHISTAAKEFACKQEEIDAMTCLRQNLDEVNQKNIALQQVEERNDTLLTQASKDQLRIVELEKQVNEYKVKLSKAKQLLEEAAKADQERIEGEQERARRAQSVFSFE